MGDGLSRRKSSFLEVLDLRFADEPTCTWTHHGRFQTQRRSGCDQTRCKISRRQGVIREIRKSGSRTARERILDLLDDGSFVEVDAFVKHRSGDHGMHLHEPLGDGVVAGHGMLDGRRVVCFSQDFAVFSGTMGEMHARKICKILELAEKGRLPVIGIWDGDGQRPHEGVTSLAPTERFWTCWYPARARSRSYPLY